MHKSITAVLLPLSTAVFVALPASALEILVPYDTTSVYDDGSGRCYVKKGERMTIVSTSKGFKNGFNIVSYGGYVDKGFWLWKKRCSLNVIVPD
jgi:hypothetical protein